MAKYSSEAKKTVLPDQDQIRKVEYFQSIYPQNMKLLRGYVVEECDLMDYEGSPMYDEYPDQQTIRQICKKICERIPANVFSKEEPILQQQQLERRRPGPNHPPAGPPPWNPPSGPPPWGPPPGPNRPPYGPPPGPNRPPYGPPPGPNRPPSGPPPWGPPPSPKPRWLQDIIQILFMNEMQNRRCRTGRC